ncbi:MAG: DUF167 family protein [Candidatus Bathyarchaeota archaeon]|nr:DUF167 family protein [Candidatus Bathyarchaeota archaeon]MDH5732581.1 DUF167 family protein [Candidatus Bathyarchaeota archaeon]
MRLQKTSGGVIVGTHVRPKSKQFRTVVEAGELVVFCRETPVRGKVNRELIKELSRLFGRRVEILSGFSSRQKKILIRDIEVEEVSNILKAAAQS